MCKQYKLKKEMRSILQINKHYREKGIKAVLCGYNHSQSNGKAERYFQIYQRFCNRFENVKEFRNWYNKAKFYSLLD